MAQAPLAWQGPPLRLQEGRAELGGVRRRLPLRARAQPRGGGGPPVSGCPRPDEDGHPSLLREGRPALPQGPRQGSPHKAPAPQEVRDGLAGERLGPPPHGCLFIRSKPKPRELSRSQLARIISRLLVVWPKLGHGNQAHPSRWAPMCHLLSAIVGGRRECGRP